MASSHQEIQIPVQAWLQSISLSAYLPSFSGFKDTRELFNITNQELQKLGIQSPDHRAHMIGSLKLLASKVQSKNTAATVRAATPPTHTNTDKVADELKLWSDLRGVAWFHGNITRENAEQLVKQTGEFLVRESLSQPGSFVLTCNHQGQLLHFVINKFTEHGVRGAVKSIEYGFESSRFISVQALILAHVADGSVVTTSSQAKIKTPVNRTAPLPVAPPGGGNNISKNSSLDSSDYEVTSPSVRSLRKSNNPTPSHSRPSSPKQVIIQEDTTISRVNSEPRLNKDDQTPPSTTTSGRFMKRGNQLSKSGLTVPTSMSNSRARSEGQLNITPSQLPNRSAELKISRNTSARAPPVIAIRNRELYDEGADYSDYFEVKRMPGENSVTGNTTQTNDVSQSKGKLQNQSNSTPQNSAQSLTNQNTPAPEPTGEDDYDVPAPEVREIHQFTTPTIPTNYIDAYNFKSNLLSNQNKPLDPNCMYKLKEVLFQGNHLQFSQHITYLDLHLFKVIENRNLGAGIFSGIEALTLPQGRHFRQAAIERHCCLSFIVSVTVLACTDDLMERSQMVKQWLLIAKDLLRAHGNLLSFAAIMDGLSAHPIQRLMMTWNILERSEPVLINHWRTQLRPAYKDLTESANSLSSDNICIPYILPISELLEVDFIPAHPIETDDLVHSLAQMDLARLMSGQTSIYSQKGVKILRFFSPKTEITDLCKVELHMRLLFGHRGALAKHAERKVKFRQILNILSERAENNDLGTEF